MMKRRTLLALLLVPDWPASEAETLAGRRVDLAALWRGQPAVVVWSFSRAAGEKSRDWMVALEKEGHRPWAVALLEATPRLLRPLIRSGMRKGLSNEQQQRHLLLYKDEKRWRHYLALRNEEVPLVVLFDAQGAVAWLHAGPFHPVALAELGAARARF